MNKDDNSGMVSMPSPSSRRGKKLLFTEEGVVTMLGVGSTLFAYLSHDTNDTSPGFASRRLMWLEPYIGEHYLSITLAILTLLMAAYTWIKHKG
jgi:hypothetical protein